MKQRISALDLKLIVSELSHSIKGYRLQNIYSMINNSKSYLFKFAIPDSKKSLVVESGVKLHLTDFQRPTTQQPSNFVVKLRKHLKAKRLTNIKQVGDDRLVVFEFSDGMYYLVLEFFSGGNVILLDQDQKIMTLQRLVSEKENNEKYATGEFYKMFEAKKLFNETPADHVMKSYAKEDITQWLDTQDFKIEQARKTGKTMKPYTIQKLLFVNAPHLSSDLIHIVLREKGIDPTSDSTLYRDEGLLDKLLESLNEAESRLSDLLNRKDDIEGYIVSKKNPIHNPSTEGSLEYIYDEFHPYEPTHKQSSDTEIKTVKGYNKTIDDFFTTIEVSKHSLKEQQQRVNAEKRLQSVKSENLEKIAKLTEAQLLNIQKGEVIMVYSDVVEQCKAAVQSLLDQQMDWNHIEKLIGVEKKRGNEIAKMINLPLNLIENKISLALPLVNFDEPSDEDDETESDSEDESDSESSNSSDEEDINDHQNNSKKQSRKKDSTINVNIDLGLSAYANASTYFDAKKSAQDKLVKTEKNSELAIKSAESKINRDLKKQKNSESSQVNNSNAALRQIRDKFWFEKYFWFISSDGFLCVAGRDDQQFDHIYFKYFNNDNDLLVSNELEGALKVIVKNPFLNKDVAPNTFIQAGAFSLSTTKAWENKMVTSPWFVKGSSVSKKDVDGSALAPGLVNITSEKQFLPPCQMIMGFGMLWLGDKKTNDDYLLKSKSRTEELGLESVDINVFKKKKMKELEAMIDSLSKYEKELEKTQIQDDKQSTTDNTEEDNKSVISSLDGLDITETQTQVKRGRRAKLKKIKQKYADQDEEDKLKRMELLGTLKQVQAQEDTGKQLPKPGQNNIQQPSSTSKVQKKNLAELHQLRKLLEEFESPDDEEASPELHYTEILSTVISSPKKTDTIVDAVPVFAPWSSLNKLKYKVKVQPGNNKKGKSVTDVVEYFKKLTQQFAKDEEDWFDKEGVISTIGQQDLLMPITVSKLKVVFPGSQDKKGNNNSGKTKSKGKKKN